MGSAASRTPAKSLSRAQTTSALGEALVTNNRDYTPQPALAALPSIKVANNSTSVSPEVPMAPVRPAPVRVDTIHNYQCGARTCLYEGTLVASKAVGDEDVRPRPVAHVQLVVDWPEELYQATIGDAESHLTGQRQATIVALRVDRLPSSADSSSASGPMKPPRSPQPQPSPQSPQSPPAGQPQRQLLSSQSTLPQSTPQMSLPPGLETGSVLRCAGTALEGSPGGSCEAGDSVRRLGTGSNTVRERPQRSDTAYSSSGGGGGSGGFPSASPSAHVSRTTTPSPLRTSTLPPIAPAAAATTTASAAAAAAAAAAAGLRAGGMFLHAGQWSGVARDGPSGALRFRSCAPPGTVEPPEAGPQALSLELLPQPYLYHFALVYRSDEASGLRDELLAQLASMTHLARPLRVWDMGASAAGGGGGGGDVSSRGDSCGTAGISAAAVAASAASKPPSFRLGASLRPSSARSSSRVAPSPPPSSGGGGGGGGGTGGAASSSGGGGGGASSLGITSTMTGGVTLVAGGGAGGAAGVGAAANLLVLLSPGVWECEEVVSALRQVRDGQTSATSSSSSVLSSSSSTSCAAAAAPGSSTRPQVNTVGGIRGSSNGNSIAAIAAIITGGISGAGIGFGSISSTGGGGGGNVLLMYMAAADAFGGCHVPTPRTAISPVPELLTIASRVAVDLGKVMASVPSDLAGLFDEVEAIPYRLHPHAAAAAVRHIVQMGGCGARLNRELAPSELEGYVAPLPADAPSPQPYRKPGGPQPPAFYYEGVALRGGTLRGWYQATATFEDAASQIRMEVSYEAKISESMPSYTQKITLHWQPDHAHGGGQGGGHGGSVMQIGEVASGNYRGRWEGRLAAVGGEMRLMEARDELVLRPQPFFFHFYVAGAADVAGGFCALLASGLQQQSSPARRVRLYESCGRPEEERHAAMDCSAAVLAVLSPAAWSDAVFRNDIRRAGEKGRRVLFLYDPDPRMPWHVQPQSAVRGAPPGVVSALLAASDVYPYYRRWYEQDACLRQLLRAAGFARCVRLPTDNDHFLYELSESKSDLASLAILRERRWVYYEGTAERAGNVWGWYQIDAKFKPELDLVEMWVEFESKNPGSIPSYRAVFLLDWNRSNNTVTERQGSWKGRVGGMAGSFSLTNRFGDALKFVPQPHIWHYFLSHVQRETSDACALLAVRLAELSVQGRRLRCWYDNQAGAVNREAMALGVAHSQHFLLVLSPSSFESAYVRFEIQTALLLRKSTIVLYDSDPSSRTHVDLATARAAAPPELRPLFDGPCLPWRGLRGGADADVFVREIMEVSGFSDLYCGAATKEPL